VSTPKVTRVTVTLKNGKTGSGKTIRNAIGNALDKSKCLHCDKTQADAWEASMGMYCEGSATGVHEFSKKDQL